MQRAFRLTQTLALLVLCHCGGSAALRAVEEGRLTGLSTVVADEVKRGALNKGDAEKLARAVGRSEIGRATGTDGLITIRELAPCAASLDEALEKRAAKEDAVGAAAAMVLIEAGLASPGDFTRRSSGPGSPFRAVHGRSLLTPEDGPERRALIADPDERVRLAALRAAELVADSADLEALLEAARLDPSPRARIQAVLAAGAIGGERVVLALKDLWALADEPLREAITRAWAMPRALDEGGRRELSWASDTERGAPELAAALALVRVGGEGSAGGLGVIERAIQAGPLSERILAIKAAPLSVPPLLAAVIKAQEDQDPSVVVAASSRRLETTPDQGGAKPDERKALLGKLLKLAASENKLPALGARAALGRAGAKEVLPLLEKDAHSPDAQARKVAGTALVALGELPRAAVLAVDPEPHVRISVACSILRSSP